MQHPNGTVIAFLMMRDEHVGAVCSQILTERSRVDTDRMRKILLVDDENLILYGLCATFRDHDTTIVTASTGAAALAALDRDRFDVCILDMNLPDMCGLDIMKKVRHSSPGTRIIMMSGDEITRPMMEVIEDNAHLLMDKPFDLEVVKRFVDRILMTGKPLLRDESRALKDANDFIKWISSDVRKHERKPVYKSITCFTLPSPNEREALTLAASVLDISDAGMCIRINHPLAPGRVLTLRDEQTHCTGVVRWCRSGETVATYLSGVQFTSPPTAPV